MISNEIDLQTRKAANAARLWYVPLMVFSVFGILYADSRFYAAGDAAATMGKILTDEGLFRLCITGFLAGQVSQIFVMLALYGMFASVDKDRARALFAFVVVMVPIAFLNIVGKFAPIILLKDPGFLKAFESGQLQALAMLFIELQKYGQAIVDIFWGLWLIPLGILVYKSGWFPRILGILLFVGCAGYVAGSLAAIAFPSAGRVVTPIANALAFGEPPFVLWLIVFGVRNPFAKRRA
jgi:hypothetical protein